MVTFAVVEVGQDSVQTWQEWGESTTDRVEDRVEPPTMEPLNRGQPPKDKLNIHSILLPLRRGQPPKDKLNIIVFCYL